MERREALTLATTWTGPENTTLRRAADTGRTGRESTGGKRPEQADPHREWVPGGQVLRQVTADGNRLPLGGWNILEPEVIVAQLCKPKARSSKSR